MFRLGWREEGGGGGADREQRGRNEGGMEITTMSVNNGFVSTSSRVAVHHHKENSVTRKSLTGREHILVNPWRACAARVTVLALCVCLSVCLSVCLLPL